MQELCKNLHCAFIVFRRVYQDVKKILTCVNLSPNIVNLMTNDYRDVFEGSIIPITIDNSSLITKKKRIIATKPKEVVMPLTNNNVITNPEYKNQFKRQLNNPTLNNAEQPPIKKTKTNAKENVSLTEQQKSIQLQKQKQIQQKQIALPPPPPPPIPLPLSSQQKQTSPQKQQNKQIPLSSTPSKSPQQQQQIEQLLLQQRQKEQEQYYQLQQQQYQQQQRYHQRQQQLYQQQQTMFAPIPPPTIHEDDLEEPQQILIPLPAQQQQQNDPNNPIQSTTPLVIQLPQPIQYIPQQHAILYSGQASPMVQQQQQLQQQQMQNQQQLSQSYDNQTQEEMSEMPLNQFSPSHQPIAYAMPTFINPYYTQPVQYIQQQPQTIQITPNAVQQIVSPPIPPQPTIAVTTVNPITIYPNPSSESINCNVALFENFVNDDYDYTLFRRLINEECDGSTVHRILTKIVEIFTNQYPCVKLINALQNAFFDKDIYTDNLFLLISQLYLYYPFLTVFMMINCINFNSNSFLPLFQKLLSALHKTDNEFYYEIFYYYKKLLDNNGDPISSLEFIISKTLKSLAPYYSFSLLRSKELLHILVTIMPENTKLEVMTNLREEEWLCFDESYITIFNNLDDWTIVEQYIY